jgi:hypothetical protein
MTVTATVGVAGPATGCAVEVVVRHGDRVVGEGRGRVERGRAVVTVAVGDGAIDDRDALVWTPRSPVLLDADVGLVDAGGSTLDRALSYTALREVKVTDGRFLLNGRPVFLRLVLDQGYWPETGLTPPDAAALRRDIDLTRALGFNGVRKHQKVEDPRYLALADEAGLLVWVEMPSAYRPGTVSTRRLLREFAEVVIASRNHPSVVAWVPVNESWGVPGVATDPRQRGLVEALAATARALDGSRPVSVNDGWETTGGDIVGVHDYSQDPGVLRQRYADAAALDRLLTGPGIAYTGRRVDVDRRPVDGRAVMLTEFGGVGLAGDGTWSYATAADADDLLRRYRDQWAAVHASTALAGACWTQLTDTYQETNGLLRADRSPKVPLERIAAATRGRASG